MQLSEKEIALLVQKVTSEVKNNLGLPEMQKDEEYGVVAIIADFVAAPQKVFEYIKTEYGEDIELYYVNGASTIASNFSSEVVESNEQKQEFLTRLSLAKKILLVCPTIGMLKRLKDGDDECFGESAMLRSILWKKSISVILDFEPPKFKRGTLFERIVTAIDELTSMGVTVDAFKITKQTSDGKAKLITENEVINASSNGEKTVYCDKDAIITPLAVDTARELKINIEGC